MSDREPVDIMGVFALSSPTKTSVIIRFIIDSAYRTLFTIKDERKHRHYPLTVKRWFSLTVH